MNIGHLHEADDGEITGKVRSLSFAMPVRLNPVPVPGNDKAPTHRVVTRGHDGEPVEVGAAWARKITNGDNAGKVMISLALDAMELPAPLNLSAFPEPENDMAPGRRWRVVWERKRGGGEGS